MKKYKNILIKAIGIANILGILFYYSPLSLYGYWSDTFFLLTISTGTILLLNRVDSKRLKSIFNTLCLFNFFAITFTTVSIFHGIVPVHFVPVGHFQEKDTYAYFIQRGDMGILNGCYGRYNSIKKYNGYPF